METRIRGMEQSVRDIKDSLERIGAGRDSSQNFNTIKINAGGIGIWICATACLICLVVVVIGAVAFGFQMADHSRKLDRLDEYLSAIYMAAPHLNPEVKNNVDHHPDSGKEESDSPESLR